MIKFESGFVGDVAFDFRDRFMVTIVGFCFKESSPHEKVEIVVEDLKGSVISTGVTGVEREDVGAAFFSKPIFSGFLIRIPRILLPSAFRVRSQDFVIGDWVQDSPSTDPLDIQSEYERLLAQTKFAPERKKICFMVSSTDTKEGRGDLYVALGLGFRLEAQGFSVRFSKDDVPQDSEIVVCMLPTFIQSFPKNAIVIGWIRNAVDEWLSSPSFLRLDGILCSSVPSCERVRKIAKVPCGILRIGAETELFKPGPGFRGVNLDAVSTINYWGNQRELFSYCEDLNIQFFGVLGADNLHLPIAKHYRDPIHYFDLPKLYNSARVCVDAFNELTKPYSMFNSRVYESLSSGLPVVTNQPLKVDRILKENVLFYNDSESLKRSIDAILEGDWTKRSKAAREEIVASHSWEVRSNEFVQFLSGLKTKEADIGFYPAFLDNPYQHLMYTSLSNYQARAAFDLSDTTKCQIFHLHWTSVITQAAETEDQSLIHVAYAIERLGAFLQRGGILIWTIHNIFHHELKYEKSEELFNSWLKDNASFIHVHGDAAIDELKLDKSKVIVAPIGHYIDYYENEISKSEARSALGIDQGKKVFLVFGQLRPYKGLERILNLFADDRVFLLAGEPKFIDESLLDELERKGAIIHPRRIPDWEVQYYMNAADYFLMLSPSILNSASAVLALSFGLPVIGSNRGNLKEIINTSNGALFDSDLELQSILKNPPNLSREDIIKDTKERFSWDKISESFNQKLSKQKQVSNI